MLPLSFEEARRAEEIDEPCRDPDQEPHQGEPRGSSQPPVQDVASPETQHGGDHQREPHPTEDTELPDPTPIRLRTILAHARLPGKWRGKLVNRNTSTPHPL